MNKTAACLLVALACASALNAQPSQTPASERKASNAAGSVFPARRAALQKASNAAGVNEQLLQALYISEFQRQVGVTDEKVVSQIRTIVTQWFQQRRNVTSRRNEAAALLLELLNGRAGDGKVSDDEISRKIVEVDTADNQMRNSDRRLQTVVDPLLTPVQQAKFRLFQIDIEQRIRELLAEAARPVANPQNPQRGGRG